MALFIKESELRSLFDSPSSMDGLLEMITETFRSQQRGEGVNHPDLRLSLKDRKRNLRVLSATAPEFGVGVRLFPLFSGAKDANYILLFDAENGHFLALVPGGELNVWRTGAPAGVACRHLAPTNGKELGLLGSGRQARGQLLAIRRALPSLQRVRVYSPTQDHRNRFAGEMSSWMNLDVVAVESARAAVQGAQIVDVATNCRSPVLEPHWVAPGALVISIASGQIPVELVSSSRVIVSWKKEVLEGKPAREPYTTMIASGTWSADDIIGELGDVILKKVPARRETNETVLFELAGVPLWDVTAAFWAYQWAREKKVGSDLSLA